MQIPKKYENQLFLTAKDFQEIMRLGENKAYEYLRDDPPFKVVHVGKSIRIFADSFWKWYFNDAA